LEWKVPTIYPTVSKLAGSALNNYEKKISGLLRISKVYVTSKNCTLIISFNGYARILGAVFFL
jgi:hypothetical protein